MNFKTENIPKEMKKMRNWVLYVKEKDPAILHPKKVMISTNGRCWHKAKSNEKGDWSSFYGSLSSLYKSRYDGLAFVLDDGIIFIDVDNSIDENGNLSDLAKKLLDEFPDTYAEKSCSGRGIHIFLKGKLNESFMKRNDSIGLEIYDTKRFCCMTGNIISKTNELKDYQEKLDEICKEYLKKEIPKSHVLATSPTMKDWEILDKAFKSKVGGKISRLFSGDISDYASHSNADMAFMNFMAFYTRSPSQLDSLMRSSGLYREKWDERRGDETYGSITIKSALSHIGECYQSKKKEHEMC